jgi:acetoin utilization protein AcuB
MTRDVVVVGPEFPLALAWKLMRERRIRHLPVVQAGRLQGILSDRDVLLRCTLEPDETIIAPSGPVAVAMTPAPITCTPDASVSWLASTMVDRKIDAIPVLGAHDALVGLVTSSDLLHLLIQAPSVQVLPFDYRLQYGEQLAATA